MVRVKGLAGEGGVCVAWQRLDYPDKRQKSLVFCVYACVYGVCMRVSVFAEPRACD